MRGIAEVRLGADTGSTLPLLGVESPSGNSFTLHVDGASLVPPRTPVLLLRLRTTWHRPDSQPCTLEMSCDRAELQGHVLLHHTYHLLSCSLERGIASIFFCAASSGFNFGVCWTTITFGSLPCDWLCFHLYRLLWCCVLRT